MTKKTEDLNSVFSVNLRPGQEVRIFPRMEFASDDTIEIDGIEIGPGMTQEQAETLYSRGKDGQKKGKKKGQKKGDAAHFNPRQSQPCHYTGKRWKKVTPTLRAKPKLFACKEM